MLSEELSIKMYEEPVVDNPILPLFYDDRERWSFALQVFFLNERFKMVKEASKNNECVMDRSIYGDIIFAKMLYDSGDMWFEEYKTYRSLLDNMLEHIQPPKLMVYLRTTPDRAISNIRQRGRHYEQQVEREYWERLNVEYEKYFKDYNLSELLVIDVTDLDFVKNPEDREMVISKIKEKLKNL